MKLYAICTTLDAGTSYDRQEMKDSNIQIGDKLAITDIKVGSWHTDIYLDGYHHSFNSVFFKFVDENGNDYDIYSDSKFYI